MYYVDIITDSWFCKLGNQVMTFISVQDQKKLQYPQTLSLLRVGSGDKEDMKGYTVCRVCFLKSYESRTQTLHRMGMNPETQHGTYTPLLKCLLSHDSCDVIGLHPSGIVDNSRYNNNYNYHMPKTLVSSISIEMYTI